MGVTAAAGAAGAALVEPAPARGDVVWDAAFRSWVPEIFQPLPDPPSHTPAIVIGSGFGGPALNNFFARGVSQDAQTISEQGKLMVSMLERFDKKLEEIGEYMDELDARMTRLERADRASKGKEAQQ